MNASADNVVSPAVAEVNSLVEKGLRALDEFLKLDQEQIDFYCCQSLYRRAGQTWCTRHARGGRNGTRRV